MFRFVTLNWQLATLTALTYLIVKSGQSGQNFLISNLIIFLQIKKMQSVINSVKGTALGVAEYLTPVLKVEYCYKFLYWYVLYTV